MNPLFVAVIALGLTGADDELPRALSDAEREARLLRLEARVRELEAQQSDEEAIRKLREAAAKEKQQEQEELPSRVSKIEKQMATAGQTWDASKMLSFSTPDGNFTAKIGGRIYANYRHIFDRDDGNAGGAADTFWLDTARFQLDGTFFKDFFYRVEGEAKTGEGNITATSTSTTSEAGETITTTTTTSGSAPGPFRMKDVYIGWNLGEILTMRWGQMKVPFSAEETCSSRFIDFVERSIMNRWMPAHDTGILINGGIFEKVLEWNLGVFNQSINRDDRRNILDVQDEKMAAGRLFISPFRNAGGFFKTMRLGFDFTIGDVDNAAQGDITNGDLGGTNMTDFAGTALLDGSRQRILGSFAWAYGPVSLRAEYARITQDLVDGSLESEYEVTMWLAQATWLITGEEKVIDNRIKPHKNFAPLAGGWGALELAVRASSYEVGDEVQNVGLVALTGNLETRQITVGLNWWWSPNVVWRVNYEMLSFDEDIANIKRGNEADDNQDIFIVRWQIDF